jgi:hypothetical protein
MSDNQLSEEEWKRKRKEALEKFDELRKKEERYWKEEYPRMSRPEKIKAWLGGIHTGMRYQGESTGDEYKKRISG